MGEAVAVVTRLRVVLSYSQEEVVLAMLGHRRHHRGLTMEDLGCGFSFFSPLPFADV